ncbi:hypothetical protein KRX57_08465 [Weeksellaceae bacterium TAE3-ERU29]|nr:hypothetical protein [Weeksellaceae bacterium TAE3-ERU29]
MKKRVLLLMPNYSSIYEMIILNLEKMGYEAVYHDIKEFKYKSSSQKLYNFFRKTFLRDKHYKDFLRGKNVEEDIMSTFDNSKDFFDYVLIIHPSEYTPKTVQYLKSMAEKVVAYHWEGFSRFQVPAELISAFDSFGVFDKKDYDEYSVTYPNLKLTQSFYFDFLPISSEKNIDLLYIGANLEDRLEKLKHIADISKDKNTYFRLFSRERISAQYPNIFIEDKGLKYKETLEISSKAKCLIDMKLAVHNGLSLRFFEALYFNQKVITDNPTIKEKDFYNPNNILVIEDFKTLTKESLDNFLNKGYVEIPSKIKEKYSFENWFNTMIN